VQHPQDDVKLAAIGGLADLHAVDEHVVRRVEAIVDGTARAARELRVAAIDALAKSGGQAQEMASKVLVRALLPGAAGDDLVVPIAKALLVTGGKGAHDVLRARVADAPDTVRLAVDALLKSG
jgi:hypothetical protein